MGNIGKKRKTRQIFHKLLRLFSLFLITIGVLTIVFTRQLLAPKHIITPLVIIPTLTDKAVIPADDFPTVLEKTLSDNHLSVDGISATDSGELVTFSDNTEVIFSRDKGLNQQIASLQLIKGQLTIEGKRLHRVDFRFDNPVVSF